MLETLAFVLELFTFFGSTSQKERGKNNRFNHFTLPLLLITSSFLLLFSFETVVVQSAFVIMGLIVVGVVFSVLFLYFLIRINVLFPVSITVLLLFVLSGIILAFASTPLWV